MWRPRPGPAEGARFVPGSTRPIDLAKGLIERGANVNAQSARGVTALMVAAAHNSPPMIGLLMDAGADPEIKNKQGQTAGDVAKLNEQQGGGASHLGSRLLQGAEQPQPRLRDAEQGATSQ